MIIVYFYDGRECRYELDRNWPGPQPNFLNGFVEVCEGIFLNAKDISWIEVRR